MLIDGEVYVWAPFNTENGEIDENDIHISEDDLEELIEGWEWRRYKLEEFKIVKHKIA